jgi:hypothetical protein
MFLAILPLSAAAVEFTSLATINRGLQYPTDVAVSSAGTIYTVDGTGKKILVYNDNYQLTAKVSSVVLPTTVAVSGDTILVGDTSTRTVKILNSSGTVTGDLKKAGVTAKFRLPRNITVDASGNIYVVDQFFNAIDVFDAGGDYTYSISGLSMPQDAVVVGSELFIIDQPLQNTSTTGGTSDNSVMRMSRIQIFDLVTETFVVDATRAFPANGNDTTLGQFINLQAIAADSQNNLYINDSFLNIIYKYDINGQFLGTIDESVKTPMGATVSPDGRLVVTSSGQGMLKVLGVDYIAGTDTWLNDAPLVDAGADQTVSEGAGFALDGSGSFDEDGISNYRWTQLSGPPVLPSNPFDTDSAQVALNAPAIDPEGAVLVFQLVVTDGLNKTSGAADTRVTVNNIISGSLVINDGDLYTNDELVTLTFDAPEAVEIRFANDSEPFSGAYQAFTPSSTWSLSAYDPATEPNTKTVNVEFKDAGGNTTVANSSILLDMQAPDAPGIDTSGAAGDVSWAPVADAVSYTLEYAFSSDFSDAVTLTDLDYTALTISLEGLEYGTWFWRVASTDAAGNISGWSDVGTFVHVRPNDPPVADAGANQTVSENTTFFLDASASTDDKGIQSYTWTQTGGTPALAEDPFVTESASLEVTAPEVTPEGETLTFELVVTDIFGETATATTEVTVNNTISGSFVINDAALITNDGLVTLTLDAPEAVEMRLANDSEPFEETYITYSGTYAWTLSAYDPATPENDKTVRVEFKDAGGNTTVASSSILLDMGPPAAPVIDTSGAAGEFNWAPVSDAVSYTLEYAFASDFSDAVTLAGLDYTNLTVSLDGLNWGTWYWRVSSTDAAGNIGGWSGIGTFYINAPPVADAGASQTVSENTGFTLDGSASSDDGTIQSYIWTQTGGTPVLASNPFVTGSATLAVTAPAVGPQGTTLTFELVVTDTYSLASTAATTEVSVNNTISGSLVINDATLITNDVLVTLMFDAPEAVEMRLANDSDPFGASYIAYNGTYAWTLSGYDPSTPENNKTVRVEFKDAGGNTSVASSSILLDMQPPDAPVIDTSGTAGEFSWAPVADSVSYTLEYAFASGGWGDATVLTGLDYNGVTVALGDFDRVNSYGTWYWRVKSFDAAGNASNWSSVGFFYVEADCDVVVPEIPQLAWPASEATDISRTALLETDDIDYPSECGVHQRTEWQISEFYDFSTLVMHVDTVNYPTMHQVTNLMLDPATTYYWRVKQVADSGMESDWSNVWSFRTAADYDVLGLDGILYDGSEPPNKKGEILVDQVVGDSDIQIISMTLLDGTAPLLIKELDPNTITETLNRPVEFPYGLLSFRIAVEPGASYQLEVAYTEEARGEDVGYVYTHEDGWHLNEGIVYLPESEEFKDPTVIMTWQDGGMGDADGVVNGVIVNP